MAGRRKAPHPDRRVSRAPSSRTAFLVLIVLAAVVRSAWATRNDGFTIDEPYHVVAGAAYVRTGDYRLNPEHPPLVKLWLGALVPSGVLRLPPFRPLSDKPDERAFAEGAIYSGSDERAVRSWTRGAMLVWNGGLLLLFGLALRRRAGELPALLATLFLAIDPTVAAHLPVAMTDLPVALLSALALLAGTRAVRTASPRDVAVAAVALGGALGTKHSALVAAAALVVLAGWDVARARPDGPPRARRAAAALALLAGSWVVLWGLYRFRFHESGGPGDAFNRPLVAKLADVGSPAVRGALGAAERSRLLPRAYLWGLADVTRSAVEGRSFPFFAFGERRSTTPAWYFPAILGVKLPLGLLALALGGLAWAASGRAARAPSREALVALGAGAAAFLVALASSRAGYAGVRHALPVLPALAAFAGAAGAAARVAGRGPRRAVAALFAAAALPALAVPRPWEFHNLLAGGTSGAWKRFNNEGVDLGQRSLELVRYEREVLRPRGVVPFVVYPMPPEQVVREGLRARPWASEDGTLDGTFLLAATELAPSHAWDHAAFRAVEPVDRRGNLLVYSGTFRLPWLRARSLYFGALALAHGPSRNPVKARDRFAEAVRLHPAAYAAAIELGNLELELGSPVEALAAWETALEHVPADDAAVRRALEDRVAHLRTRPSAPPPPIRNPWLE